VGHTLKGCDIVDGEVDDSTLQYREWLRASPIKSKRRNVEAEKQEGKKLFMAFRKNKEAPKAKMRLSLGGCPR